MAAVALACVCLCVRVCVRVCVCVCVRATHTQTDVLRRTTGLELCVNPLKISDSDAIYELSTKRSAAHLSLSLSLSLFSLGRCLHSVLPSPPLPSPPPSPLLLHLRYFSVFPILLKRKLRTFFGPSEKFQRFIPSSSSPLYFLFSFSI